MLTRLRLRNFKSWSDTGDIALCPITAFFGANSSGKTSLLQSLLLLKQTSESSDRAQVFHFGDRSTSVDLGDFESVVHSHDLSEGVGISIDWKANQPAVVLDGSRREIVKSSDLGYTVTAGNGGKRSRGVTVEEMAHGVGECRFGMRRNKKGYELFREGTDYRFRRRQGRPWPLPAPIRCYGFPAEVGAYYQNAEFLVDREYEFARALSRIRYLGPLRAVPERRYFWTGAEPPDVGMAGESAVAALLAARKRGRVIARGKGRRRRSVEEQVAAWLRDVGLVHDFSVVTLSEIAHLYQVVVRKTAASTPVPLPDAGFGVSRILPVFVLCFYAPEGSTIILEQPEGHLHPAVQSGLADVLIDAVAHRRVQILIESHSEHLLRRLQRRIADETLNSDQVGLWFCRSSRNRTAIEALNLDLYGSITNWPEDFFGDEFGEIAEITVQQQRRRAAR